MRRADSPRARLARLLLLCAGLLLIGGAYAALCLRLGRGIPCLFRLITGYQCPGCGVSRMFLSLLRGDFLSAWHDNAAILVLLPFGAVVAGNIAVRYVRFGICQPSRWANVLLYAMIAVLLCFGLWRNL